MTNIFANPKLASGWPLRPIPWQFKIKRQRVSETQHLTSLSLSRSRTVCNIPDACNERNFAFK